MQGNGLSPTAALRSMRAGPSSARSGAGTPRLCYKLKRSLFLVSIISLSILITASASADDGLDFSIRPGWGRWWLPRNYSVHGKSIDALFNAIFWITAVVGVLTQIALFYFLIRYRHRPGQKKARFIHGNTRLEMIWTAIPAVILGVLALVSKGVWDRYRYADDPSVAQVHVLVIGEQYKWNFVYPGKDRKLGQYLVFPQPSDPKYRKLPYDEAIKRINRDILENPLGQNRNWENDPDAKAGQDDDYDPNPGRPLILPVDKPIAIELSSKDVIHDFFLPNFRVKLDALPGMAGRINFTAETTAQSTQELSIDDPQLIGKPLWIDADTAGAQWQPNDDASQVSYFINGVDSGGSPVPVRGRSDAMTPELIADLKRAGFKRLTAVTHPFEVVCEELCGSGHYSMRGEVWFVSPKQYDAFIRKDAPANSGAAPPKVAAAVKSPGTLSAMNP
jgi:heme/copper-type cytochrome/quinol oxidase subunit 2